MTKVLVFRFSAMGDVAMVMAALKQATLENQTIEIYVLTRRKFFPFFENQERIQPIEADLDGKHKGIFGLITLFSLLKSLKVAYVLDLHQNLRTTFLKTLFLTEKSKVFTLDKGREEKKQMTSNKIFKPLKHGISRYLEVFKNAELISTDVVSAEIIPVFKTNPDAKTKIEAWLNGNKMIGLAPFAQHLGKMWPIDKYEALIAKLESLGYATLLFGGGKHEKEICDQIAQKYQNCTNVIGLFSLEQELELLSRIELLVCNDSSNMHLASLMGTKTISIWGATHPNMGFSVLFQNPENEIQIAKSELNCRPCSVYGNKPCYRGDYACLNRIEVNTVFEQIQKILNEK